MVRKQQWPGRAGIAGADAIFGAFDFHIHGARAGRDGGFENAHLFLDAAVKFSMILMTAAGGQDAAIGMARKEFADGGDAIFGRRQIIEAKFEKRFARVDFPARVIQQLLCVRKAHGNADPR